MARQGGRHVTIGVDAHKRVQQAVAIDGTGQEQARWRGGNRPADWDALQTWAAGRDGERRWGIEGSGQYGHGLAQYLVGAGEPVVEVTPRLTAGTRRGSRARGKSDRLDALAVARVVAREGEALPAVQPDDASAVLAELAADRTSAVAAATALRNELHQVLHQLGAIDPRTWPDLTTAAAVVTLVDYPAPADDALTAARVRRVRHLAARLHLALEQADATTKAIADLARPYLAPLDDLCGVAPLTAGLLATELGGHHFESDAQLASYAGVAPLEASSGEHTRHWLNRGGNRALNMLVHRIALVQLRCSSEAQAYVDQRCREAKTQREAIRCLKRYIARRVFRAWQAWTLPPLTEIEVPLI
jgi:transposase